MMRTNARTRKHTYAAARAPIHTRRHAHWLTHVATCTDIHTNARTNARTNERTNEGTDARMHETRMLARTHAFIPTDTRRTHNHKDHSNIALGCCSS